MALIHEGRLSQHTQPIPRWLSISVAAATIIGVIIGCLTLFMQNDQNSVTIQKTEGDSSPATSGARDVRLSN